jgi:hypothetical protein
MACAIFFRRGFTIGNTRDRDIARLIRGGYGRDLYGSLTLPIISEESCAIKKPRIPCADPGTGYGGNENSGAFVSPSIVG